mmetsp:Transcript_10182/g.21457  ORF Transcript_10182/g.21457 Transcript_10182/m.21457 type:complete len:216 (-) Transcript_10182:343-990(-)
MASRTFSRTGRDSWTGRRPRPCRLRALLRRLRWGRPWGRRWRPARRGWSWSPSPWSLRRDRRSGLPRNHRGSPRTGRPKVQLPVRRRCLLISRPQIRANRPRSDQPHPQLESRRGDPAPGPRKHLRTRPPPIRANRHRALRLWNRQIDPPKAQPKIPRSPPLPPSRYGRAPRPQLRLCPRDVRRPFLPRVPAIRRRNDRRHHLRKGPPYRPSRLR